MDSRGAGEGQGEGVGERWVRRKEEEGSEEERGIEEDAESGEGGGFVDGVGSW